MTKKLPHTTFSKPQQIRPSFPKLMTRSLKLQNVSPFKLAHVNFSSPGISITNSSIASRMGLSLENLSALSTNGTELILENTFMFLFKVFFYKIP